MMSTPNVTGGTGRRLVVMLVFALVASAVAVVGGGGAAGADDEAPVEVAVFSAGEAAVPLHAVGGVLATLVQTLATSTLAPSGSPDPSGLAYMPGKDDLVFTDAEINEYPTFYDADRVNIWQLTPHSPPTV